MGRKTGVRHKYSEEIDQQILGLLAEGLTQREIAARVFLEEATISIRITNLKKRYNAKTKVDLVLNHLKEKQLVS